MSTLARGTHAEAAVLHAFVRLDVPVLRPFNEGLAYDLVVDAGGRMVKVQVKAGRLRGEVVRFNSCSTDHGRGRQDYVGRADVIAVHCAENDEVYVVPVAGLASYAASIRVAPARNNQRARVRFAEDCRVETWVASLEV